MAETISNGKWLWYDIMHDLKQQGGIEVTINPLSVNPSGCSGNTEKGTTFYITWVPNTFLLLSMTVDDPALAEAFSKVVEYSPFCKYISKQTGLLTYEWDKVDPVGRFSELQNEGELNLESLINLH